MSAVFSSKERKYSAAHTAKSRLETLVNIREIAVKTTNKEAARRVDPNNYFCGQF